MRCLIKALLVLMGIVLVTTKGNAETLPPGYVQGDVVSYSYVPIKSWTLQEGIGILPYLFEYGLTLWDGQHSLEYYHAENIRRIDIASQWSTVIGLSNRESGWDNEIVNLMIRCFHNRQLIMLSARTGKHDYHQNMIDILDYLWSNRDTVLVDPEGDQATGQQLINNIVAADVGDEEECTLGAAGMQQRFAQYDQDIRLRIKNGQYPFSHIRCWLNMLHYSFSCFASSQQDVDDYGRFFLPTNTKFIGVDTYHYWTGTDPLTMTSAQRRSIADAWQDIITRYYPQGLTVYPCGSWAKECQNDTHALFNGLPAAGANQAMMIYIANSDSIPGSSYTTPIESMDAFYDSVKAGPWVGLAWWVFDNNHDGGRTLDYIDKTLTHLGGVPYTQQQLDDFHDRFVASRMRMFNDVTQNQFVAPVIAEVAPDPDLAYINQPYTKQLALSRGSPAASWSVIQGPAGTQINASGQVSGWTPNVADIGQVFAFEVRAGNCIGQDYESWNARVKSRSDFNDDNDADQEDFGHFQACLSGGGKPYPAGCADADLDKDGDVDQNDFGLFQQCMAGPNQPPGC